MQYPRIPWDQRSFELNPLVENVDLFKIYPNPTKEFIVVENLGVSLTEQTKVEIIDLNGRKVIEMKWEINSHQLVVGLDHLEVGTYILQIFDRNSLIENREIMIFK